MSGYRSAPSQSTSMSVFPSRSPVASHPSQSPVSTHPSRSPISMHPSRSPLAAHPTKAPQASFPTNSPVTKHPSRNPLPSHPSRSPFTQGQSPQSPSRSPQASWPSHSPLPEFPTTSPETTHPTHKPNSAFPTKSPETTNPTHKPNSASPTKSPETTHPTHKPNSAFPTHSPITPNDQDTQNPTFAPTSHPSHTPTIQSLVSFKPKIEDEIVFSDDFYASVPDRDVFLREFNDYILHAGISDVDAIDVYADSIKVRVRGNPNEIARLKEFIDNHGINLRSTGALTPATTVNDDGKWSPKGSNANQETKDSSSSNFYFLLAALLLGVAFLAYCIWHSAADLKNLGDRHQSRQSPKKTGSFVFEKNKTTDIESHEGRHTSLTRVDTDQIMKLKAIE